MESTAGRLNGKQKQALDTFITWSEKTTDQKLDTKIQELLEEYETYDGLHKELLYWGLSALYLEKESRGNDFDVLDSMEKIKGGD